MSDVEDAVGAGCLIFVGFMFVAGLTALVIKAWQWIL